MRREHKIWGDKGEFTLPKEFRDDRGLGQGSTLLVERNKGSVLVLAPKDQELSIVEKTLIHLLINYPSFKGTREWIEQLKTAAKDLEASL